MVTMVGVPECAIRGCRRTSEILTSEGLLVCAEHADGDNFQLDLRPCFRRVRRLCARIQMLQEILDDREKRYRKVRQRLKKCEVAARATQRPSGGVEVKSRR